MTFNIEVTTKEDPDTDPGGKVHDTIRAFASAFEKFRESVPSDVRVWWDEEKNK